MGLFLRMELWYVLSSHTTGFAEVVAPFAMAEMLTVYV